MLHADNLGLIIGMSKIPRVDSWHAKVGVNQLFQKQNANMQKHIETLIKSFSLFVLGTHLAMCRAYLWFTVTPSRDLGNICDVKDLTLVSYKKAFGSVNISESQMKSYGFELCFFHLQHLFIWTLGYIKLFLVS